jgi:hypothetical protein
MRRGYHTSPTIHVESGTPRSPAAPHVVIRFSASGYCHLKAEFPLDRRITFGLSDMTTTQLYRPVFIVGCERSGTTMLGAMLGASPSTLTTPESQFVIHLLPQAYEAIHSEDLERIIAALCAAWRLRIWGIRDLPARLSLSLPPSGAPYSYRQVISQVIRLYGEDVAKESAGIWIDHTPTHIRVVDRLLKVFPDARFLHLVRDGRAVALSLQHVTWGRTTTYKAAEWWSSQVCMGATAELKYGPARVMRVRYEDVVLEPERTLREVCKFAEIEFLDSMVEGSGFVVPAYTKRQHSLVGSRPDRQRTTEWKTKLTPREIELFEYRSGDVLKFFDYEPLYGGYATPPGRLELALIRAREAIGRIHHRLFGRAREWKVKHGR